MPWLIAFHKKETWSAIKKKLSILRRNYGFTNDSVGRKCIPYWATPIRFFPNIRQYQGVLPSQNRIKHFATFVKTVVLFFTLKKGKQLAFSKVWPPATYDVISCNHYNRFSPSVGKNLSKGYAHSYWNDNCSWKIVLENFIKKHKTPTCTSEV